MFTPSIRFLHAIIYSFFSIFKNEKKTPPWLEIVAVTSCTQNQLSQQILTTRILTTIGTKQKLVSSVTARHRETLKKIILSIKI